MPCERFLAINPLGVTNAPKLARGTGNWANRTLQDRSVTPDVCRYRPVSASIVLGTLSSVLADFTAQQLSPSSPTIRYLLTLPDRAVSGRWSRSPVRTPEAVSAAADIPSNPNSTAVDGSGVV